MTVCHWAFGAILLVSGPALAADSPAAAAKVAGWIERIVLPDQSLMFDAKLDTGADISSINATVLERAKQAGSAFVRIELTDDSGTVRQFDAPYVRTVRVKRSGTEVEKRFVVSLKLCIAGEVIEGEFTLADRGNLKEQILIGRNLLSGRILVDSGRTRLASDQCALPQ
jgi:hypothetical protein